MIEPFSPPDMILAHDNLNAMCGHGALAAALGIPVMDAMQYFDNGGWVNIPMMCRALTKAGKSFAQSPVISPEEDGIICIQWTGPTIPLDPRGACKFRHWVAANNGQIWDASAEKWNSQDDWKKLACEIAPAEATSYKIATVLLTRWGAR